MKYKSILIVLLLCQLVSFSQNLSNTYLRYDTIWTTDTVRLSNSIVVESSATLTINPGVFVEFQGNYSIDVFGKIIANGTPNDSIVFTVKDFTHHADTSTKIGGWGGIRLFSNDTDTSVFSYCRFSYGKAVVPGVFWGNPENEDNRGGAIYLNGYAHLQIRNSKFFQNRANYSGGGLMIKNNKSVNIVKNVFENNNTYVLGGGVFIESSEYAAVEDNLFVRNSAFQSTTTSQSGAGSGLAVYCNTTITNNKFFNNITVLGALYESSFNSYIANNIIANNAGTGLLVGGWDIGITSLVNNTIVNNHKLLPNGCGIMFFSDQVKMRNNIVFGNTSTFTSIDPIQIYTPLDVKADFAYSCNPDEPIYYEGEGNIQEDPLFVNPTAGAGPDYDGLSADWSLLDSSPCVNTGTPDTTGLHLPETDILGNPRIYGIRIDMGAIENQMVVGLPKNPLVSASLQISPNPFGQSFKVVTPGGQKISSISLYNQNGKLLGKLEKLPFDQLMVYDLAKQPAGLYLMVTQFENGNVESTKLVKY
jgi:hypothetical protein